MFADLGLIAYDRSRGASNEYACSIESCGTSIDMIIRTDHESPSTSRCRVISVRSLSVWY